MSQEKESAGVESDVVDREAGRLYEDVIPGIEHKLDGVYELRSYDKTRLMLFCREVYVAHLEQLKQHRDFIAATKKNKTSQFDDSLFMPGQEVKARFYNWLSEHGTEKFAKRIEEVAKEEEEYRKRFRSSVD